MVQGRAAGNGNFDIDAITRLVNADAIVPAVIDQPFIDPAADAFAADVDDMVDELRFNPSSNLTEEAQQIMNSPLAAKLGAGVMADLRAAVQLQEEKAANGADAFMRGDRVWEERKERDDKDRKEQARIADFADDAQNASQRMTPEQWDQAPSREYPGMTNAEALSAIRRINGNLPFYSQLAVQRGLVRPEQEADFQTYMRNEQWLMEQKRAGNTETPEYRLRRQQQDSLGTVNPNFETASRSVVNAANDRGVGPLATTIISGGRNDSVAFGSGVDAFATDAGAPLLAATTVSGGQSDALAFGSRVNTLSMDAGAPSPATIVPVSVAATLDRTDGVAADRTSLASTFNSSANGATPPPAAVAPTALAPPRVAAAGFDQSTGMI